MPTHRTSTRNVFQEHDLLWIAEEALCCPLPSGWSEHSDTEGNIYFHNATTDVSTYEHPMDSQYKVLTSRAKADKSADAIESLRSEVLSLKRDQLVDQPPAAEPPDGAE